MCRKMSDDEAKRIYEEEAGEEEEKLKKKDANEPKASTKRMCSSYTVV